MKYVAICASILLLLFASTGLSQRQLDMAEILDLFGELTANPQKTWISQGTIEAIHEQFKASKTVDSAEINLKIKEELNNYLSLAEKRLKTDELQKFELDAIPFNVRCKLSNEYSMVSTEKVIFDGEKYYWETEVQSRQDSVSPGIDLAGNYMTNNFRLDWNKKRVNIWDGQKASIYSLPVNNAVIDTVGMLPHSVNGAIKAGLIPWGYGKFSYENLVSYESQAAEHIVDGQSQITLSFTDAGGKIRGFVLDGTKGNAVLSYSTGSNNTTTTITYSGYQLAGSKWVPGEIVIEKYDDSSNRLLARDRWEITNVDVTEPVASDFVLNYQPDAVVEYTTYLASRNQIYQSSTLSNDDDILADRLEYLANEGAVVQNCATASLGYALKQLGVSVEASELSGIVGADNMTSLLQLKQQAESLGLHVKAASLDIEMLQDIEGLQVILHLPGKDHFVVLESADAEYIKVIDLSDDKFRYYKETDFFDMDWADGTALLISANPISGDIEDIASEELPLIKGGSGYSCTRLLQELGYIYCELIAEICTDNYVIYWERWGCEPAASGSCSTSWMYRRSESPCITDPILDCDITGEWTHQYIRACL